MSLFMLLVLLLDVLLVLLLLLSSRPCGRIVRKKNISIDLLNQAIQELYALLYRSLEEGIIDKDVVKGSCQYCDYKAICQFRGEEKDERNRTSIESLIEGEHDETES